VKKRPGLVTAVAVLLLILGIGLLVAGVLRLAYVGAPAAQVFGAPPSADLLARFEARLPGAGTLLLVRLWLGPLLGLVMIVAACGLFDGSNWARLLAVAWAGLCFAVNVGDLVFGVLVEMPLIDEEIVAVRNDASLGGLLAQLILPCIANLIVLRLLGSVLFLVLSTLVLVGLTRPQIKAAFVAPPTPFRRGTNR
jgi:hypothetical protein